MIVAYSVEFNGVLAFRQQHRQPGAFGRSDLFFVCRMTPLTYELRPCTHETAVCQWMTLEQLETSGQASAVTEHVFEVVHHGLTNGFDQVLIGCSERPSIYRNRSFNIFSLLAKISDGGNCVHDVVDAPDEIL